MRIIMAKCLSKILVSIEHGEIIYGGKMTIATKIAQLEAQFRRNRCSTAGTKIACEIERLRRQRTMETKLKLDERKRNANQIRQNG